MIGYELEWQIPDVLQTALRNKRLIFTIAAEQYDTDFLTRTLSFVPNIVCPADSSFAQIRQQLQADQACVYEFWLTQKLPRIAECRSPIYIETSHLFGKGFVESLVDLGIVPDLIVLTNPIRETAVRLYQSGMIPGRAETEAVNLLTPDDDDVLPLFGWQKLHDYQLCYWYCLEMARRSQKYAKLCRALGGRIVTTTLTELESLTGFHRFVTALDLPWLGVQQWLHFAWARQHRPHNRMHARDSFCPDEIEQLEQTVIEYVGLVT